MELWIRSQDKMKLVKVNYLYIMDQQDHFTIIGETVDSGPIVGAYKSKERALEVLNEIQNLLQPKIKYIQEEPIESIVDFGYQITQNVDMKIQEINTIVYNMPKE